MSLLDISVADGESGPVVLLAGEADLTTLAELNGALATYLEAGTKLLTIDLSRLRFADSATIAALIQITRTMRDLGGRLELLRPQPAVARVLELMGADQVLTVRDDAI